jgi:hypothetical protein
VLICSHIALKNANFRDEKLADADESTFRLETCMRRIQMRLPWLMGILSNRLAACSAG